LQGSDGLRQDRAWGELRLRSLSEASWRQKCWASSTERNTTIDGRIPHWGISYQKLLAFRFLERVTRVHACVCRCAPWFLWAWREQADQSPHGRDGRAPLFCLEKSNFIETLVSPLRSSPQAVLLPLRPALRKTASPTNPPPNLS
jgi:hypothetical protein